MKDNTLYLEFKASSPIFLEKPTVVLYQYFFISIRVIQMNLTPTYSVHLMTTFFPQKDTKFLSLQKTSLIFVFQLNRLLFFVMFKLCFNFLLVLGFFHGNKTLLCLVIVFFAIYVSVFGVYVSRKKQKTRLLGPLSL